MCTMQSSIATRGALSPMFLDRQPCCVQRLGPQWDPHGDSAQLMRDAPLDSSSPVSDVADVPSLPRRHFAGAAGTQHHTGTSNAFKRRSLDDEAADGRTDRRTDSRTELFGARDGNAGNGRGVRLGRHSGHQRRQDGFNVQSPFVTSDQWAEAGRDGNLAAACRHGGRIRTALTDALGAMHEVWYWVCEVLPSYLPPACLWRRAPRGEHEQP